MIGRPVRLEPYEYEHAAQCAARRITDSAVKGLTARGASATKTLEELLTLNVLGAAAELAAAKALGVYWPAHVGVAKDVPDLPPDWEVRGTSRPDGNLLLTPRDRPDRRYVLVTVAPGLPNLIVRGWVWGHEGMREEFLRDHDRMPEALFIIPCRLLHPIP
jgi:hypothetical protein